MMTTYRRETVSVNRLALAAGLLLADRPGRMRGGP